MGAFRRAIVFAAALAAFLGAASPNGWCQSRRALEPTLSLEATPSFVGASVQGATIPLVVSVTNRGRDTDADIIVQAGNDLVARHRYFRHVRLSGGGATQRFFMYPYLDYSPYSNALRVSLRGPFGERETTVTLNNTGTDNRTRLCLVSDHLGTLHRVRNGSYITKPDYTNQVYSESYIRPQDVPDRPSGFDGVSILVLGQGAERLTAPQQAAISSWVTSGGPVIVLPSANLPRNTKLFSFTTPALSLRSQVFLGSLSDGDGHQVAAVTHRSSGLGKVFYCNIDPTTSECRRNPGLTYFWVDMVNHVSGFAGSPALVRGLASTARPWRMAQPGDSVRNEPGENDPFRLRLPSLKSVLYVFLAYFVLVVPVTFVVLKRLRRMNWAWATGPALAVLFAGVFFLFTANLYNAKLSRRTAGIVVAAAGAHEAHFVGYTEMFFPHAGKYDVTVPDADRTELADDEDRGGAIQPIDTTDNGLSVAAPGLEVANLAFRRLYHSQTVSLGEGITTDLKLTPDGTLVGTVTNRTGQTLTGANVAVPVTFLRRGTKPGSAPQVQRGTSAFPLPDLEPGTSTHIQVTRSRVSGVTMSLTQALLGSSTFAPARSITGLASGTPILLAKTSGESFGPALGTSVGGADSVTIAVGLPALNGGEGTWK